MHRRGQRNTYPHYQAHTDSSLLFTWVLKIQVKTEGKVDADIPTSSCRQDELDSVDTSVVISSCSLSEARHLLDHFLKASIDKVGGRRARP